LTRRSGDLPKEGDERLLTNRHAVLKPQNLIDLPDAGWPDAPDVINCLSLMANDASDARQPDAGGMDVPGPERIDVPDAGWISTLLAEAYEADPFPERIMGLLRNGARQCKEISLDDCQERDSRLSTGTASTYQTKYRFGFDNGRTIMTLPLWVIQDVPKRSNCSQEGNVMDRVTRHDREPGQ